MGFWCDLHEIQPKKYKCGYCDCLVGSDVGYVKGAEIGEEPEFIYICSNCGSPTYFNRYNTPMPAVRFGNRVYSVPNDIEQLYNEARACTEVGAYTSAVLTCRKLLMNIAVHLGANENLKFKEYVDFLVDNGHVTQSCKDWVDAIRKKGNEATHEIELMNQDECHSLLTFVEMLLKLVFEFPKKVNP